MRTELSDPVKYTLPLSDQMVEMNKLIGNPLRLEFSGDIHCIYSGKKIKKTYGQGYAYEYFIKLARCDSCIVKPELCHFHKGTCREPQWGEDNCMQPHIIYIANSSQLKVGITRKSNVPYRWIDQGASYALPILEVKDRYTSGLIEVEIAKKYKDKTNWRAMLQGQPEEIDLEFYREQIFDEFADLFDDMDAEEVESDVVSINYPVHEYPEKVKSLGFDKQNVIEGVLLGIKGQYLIFDCGVVNMRKHQGYYISLEY